MRWYLGIDPGNQGGLALIHGGVAIEYERMMGIEGLNKFLSNVVFASEGNVACVYEEHRGGGPQTNANAHRSAGYYHGVFSALCHVHGIPLHMVTPQCWKRMIGANKDKQRSITLAKQIFPNINLIFPRCRNEHDGCAEALLIAEYGRIMQL